MPLDEKEQAIQKQAQRPPASAPASQSFDPDATILALPRVPSPPEPDLDDSRTAPAPTASAPPLAGTAADALPPLPMALPPLPPEVAAARPQGLPPLPAGNGPSPGSSGSRSRWLPFALIALTVIGLSVFLMRPAEAPEPGASPQDEAENLEDPDRIPVISVDIWPLMTRVCGLDETAERELPGRAQGGAPIVQVYSINTEEALGVLSKLQDRGAFLLPIEEDGQTFCTVALGPFPTLDSAREYAGGLRASGIAPEAQVAYFPFFRR